MVFAYQNTNINKQIYKNMFQINEKHRIWNLKIEYGFCYVGFAYKKISTSKYTQICFKAMKQKLESGICYVDFA